MDLSKLDLKENRRRMDAGELFYAFTPDLLADRSRSKRACKRFNQVDELTRRRMVELWKDINQDTTPLPAEAATDEEDDKLLARYPYIDGPIMADYGSNLKFGDGVYVNCNSMWLDTCIIEVGARTLIGPNCSFYSATHPLDPFLRNGTSGPEGGKPIKIGEDCWFGGGCTVLPGVTIGRGVVVGAASVVTKNVPDFVVVAGNPARIIRRLEVGQEGSETLAAGQKTEQIAS